MVTVAILAIVASIAYPAYTGYAVTANRSDGKIALNKIAMAQERFFSENNSYTANISLLPGFNSNPYLTEKWKILNFSRCWPGRDYDQLYT